MLIWPEFSLPPINLWVMPSLTYIEYKEDKVGSRVRFTSTIKYNPIYDIRVR